MSLFTFDNRAFDSPFLSMPPGKPVLLGVNLKILKTGWGNASSLLSIRLRQLQQRELRHSPSIGLPHLRIAVEDQFNFLYLAQLLPLLPQKMSPINSLRINENCVFKTVGKYYKRRK